MAKKLSKPKSKEAPRKLSKFHIVNVQRAERAKKRFNGEGGPGGGHKSYVPEYDPISDKLDDNLRAEAYDENGQLREGYLIDKNGVVKKKGGPPRISTFTPETFEALCQIWCTKEEICSVFRMSHDTLQERIAEHYKNKDGTGRTFTSVYEEFKTYGNISLRRKQREIAVSNGNTSMLIWLGQQELGQSNKSQMNGRITGEESDKFGNEYEIRETLYNDAGERKDQKAEPTSPPASGTDSSNE